jgi:nucleotide-binding universal stress UspA family protein
MNKLTKILVASDFSTRADYALARAMQLAGQHGAELLALHVIEPVRASAPAEDWLWPSDEFPETLERDLEAEAQAELERRVGALPGAANIRARIETRFGTSYHEIIGLARAQNVDLVVVGAHGRAYLRDLLLGTTAERVVRKGDRPVLVVKMPCNQAYRRVLASVDFSDTSKEAIRFSTRVAPKAQLELLHAYEIWFEGKLRDSGMSEEQILAWHQQYEQQAREELKVFAHDCKLDPAAVRFLVRQGYPGTTIARAVIDQRADLIAIGTRGLSGIRYVLLGSVAEHVLREAPADVLVARPAAAEFELP